MTDGFSYASEVYLHLKSRWKGRTFAATRRSGQRKGSAPFAKGRDPHPIGDVLSLMTKDLGWTEQLTQSLLVTEWDDLVGADIAQHTEVLSIERKVLRVQCDSTAWATQLRRMRKQIVSKIHEVYPDANIEDVSFQGPHTPSWRHGARTVQGRGPRDTYG